MRSQEKSRTSEEPHPTSEQTRTYEYYYDGATPTALTARDDLGQLSAVTGVGYSKVFTHRPDGLLASRTTAVAGFPAIKLELTYYEDGSPHTQRITQLDESGDALSSSERVLGVDGYGRLKEVTLNGSGLVTTTYDGNGLLSGGSFANGDLLTFAHEPTTRRLVGSTQASASYVSSTLQEMNSRGLVESETTTIGGTTLARTFGYSAQRFLESAVDAQSSYSYGFDGFGLPTFVTTNGEKRAFFETPANLTAGQVVYGFDSLHRTVSRNDASAPAQDLVLTYGPDGQVATATKGGVTYQYRYDEDGQRLVKLTGATPAVAYLPEGYLDSTGLTERFALGGRTVGIIKNGVYTTIATDLRGSVLAEATGVARVASPFGQRDVHPAMAAAIDYVEKGYDADLGWVRMGVRDYDPEINRFTTPDPLFLEDSQKCLESPVECNLYAYARNAPSLFIDPSGKGAMPSVGPPQSLRWMELANDLAKQLTDTFNEGLGKLQAALDVAGLAPGVGTPADVTNSAISAARGNWKHATINLAGVVGLDLVKVGKLGKANDVAAAVERSAAGGLPMLPRSLGAAANITTSSRIGATSYATRLAEGLGQAAQRDVDALLGQLRAGNMNPGIGTRALGNGFFELRGANAGRVIVKQTDSASFDIVGKFQGHVRGDTANGAIIERLMNDYLGL